MKELVKSANSLAWAASLYPAQWLLDFLPQQPNQAKTEPLPEPKQPTNMQETFEYYTAAIEKDFGNTVRATYRVGDQVQSLMVDLTAGFFRLQSYNPLELMKMNLDLTEAVADTLRQYLPGGAKGAEQNRPWGWGPVDPPDN